MAGRRLGAWGAACFALSLMVGCAAGNSVVTTVGDGSTDGAFDGTSPSGDGSTHTDGKAQTDSGSGGHHDSGAGHDAAHDAPAHEDGGVEGGLTCVSPQVKCGSSCTDTQEDPNNCGACGHACTTGLVCSSGVCSINCAAGQTRCTAGDGGTPPPVDAGVVDASLDADASSAADSGGGTNPSGAYCADTTDDRLNCGGCDIICPYGPHSTAVCTASACSITCDPNYADCDGNPANGCEVETDNNPASCGACGVVCAAVNDTPNCVAGVCGIASCNSGFANCDGNVRNGCETNTDTTTNCGGCGNMCTIANGNASCPAGSCTVQSCNTGFGDCDTNPANGCETNTTSSVGNCGGCGSVCTTPNATPACSGSKCAIASCNAGFADCDGNSGNGCEINVETNPSDCGMCGLLCNVPNATAACQNGMCAVGTCDPGYADCDGNPANGCEVNTNTTTTNCGACGHTCTIANGTAGCSAGACTVASCNAGYADCDGNPANGCEANTTSNPNDCGTCGHVCSVANGTAGCAASACTVASCNAGFANCDGNAANGCEVNTTSDPNNCGSCGDACEVACGGAADHVAAGACGGGVCSVSVCSGGYLDFDGKCADGCECAESSTESVCANATSLFAGTLGDGQSITAFTSTMMPTTVTQAYFTLTFGGNGTTTYHPTITLTSTSGEFIMDVSEGCTDTSIATNSCTDHGSSLGLTSWEQSYTGPNPPADPNSLSPAGVSNFQPITPVNQVYIRVYRKTGVPATCDTYTINATG